MNAMFVRYNFLVFNFTITWAHFQNLGNQKREILYLLGQIKINSRLSSWIENRNYPSTNIKQTARWGIFLFSLQDDIRFYISSDRYFWKEHYSIVTLNWRSRVRILVVKYLLWNIYMIRRETITRHRLYLLLHLIIHRKITPTYSLLSCTFTLLIFFIMWLQSKYK